MEFTKNAAASVDAVSTGGWNTGPVKIAHLRDADWQLGLRPYFAYRDLGIKDSTKGQVGVHVLRATEAGDGSDRHLHKLDFQMIYVLKGWIKVWLDGVGEDTLIEGSSMYQTPNVEHKVLSHSDDVEILEITVPANFETRTTGP